MKRESNPTGATPVIARESGAPVPPGPGKAQVAIGFANQDTDAKLVDDSGHILVSMKDNPAYAAPVPSLEEITAARNRYIALISAAKENRIALARRRDARAALVGLLRKLALYVQLTCNGDLATLLSSGFPARRTRQPVGTLSAPLALRVVRGKISGQIIARCKVAPGARAYQWRCAPAATPDAWLPVVTTPGSRGTVEGLVACTGYLVQARVVGSAGASDWSEPATVIVL